MSPTDLIKKLGLKPAQSALVLNAPAGYLERLGELPEGIRITQQAEGKPHGEYDFVQLFVKDRAEFEALNQVARQAVSYDGLLWICYPKKSAKFPSDLSRDMFWELMDGTGLRPVMQIAIDETWSALRFRPGEKVGK